MSKTILVTGASSGFGLLIATKLHESGHRVIGTSRFPEKQQTEVPFQLMTLDIADDASVASFVKNLFGHIQQLDVLINNAGYLLTGLAEETPVELGKQQFENAPSPEPVIATVLKVVEAEAPKFSYPVGKGNSFLLTMQRFAYKTLENAILKRVDAAI